jgi:hypothetical protein
MRKLNAIYSTIRSTMMAGIDSNIEIHAVEWVHDDSLFPAGVATRDRITLLRRFMVECSRCPGIRAINVLADSSAPRDFPDGQLLSGVRLESHLRRLVFAKLYEEFECHLAINSHKGQVWIDENKLGAVVEVAKKMSHRIPRQPIRPVPISSEESPAVQVADVIAYFMLQQVQPNSPVASAGATGAINDVAYICPDVEHPGVALVHFV